MLLLVGVCLCQMSILFIVLFLSREREREDKDFASMASRMARSLNDLCCTYNSRIYMQIFIDADATCAWRSERGGVIFLRHGGERACEKERDGRKGKTDRDAGY